MCKTILFQCKHAPAPEAAHGRDILQEQCGQVLDCEELQIPCVRETLYLQGGWEGLPDHLRTPPTTGHSYQGGAKQNHPVGSNFTKKKSSHFSRM